MPINTKHHIARYHVVHTNKINEESTHKCFETYEEASEFYNEVKSSYLAVILNEITRGSKGEVFLTELKSVMNV